MKESTTKYLNKSLIIFMLGFVFLNPIPHTTTIKEILFYLSCLIFTILVSTKKINCNFKTPLTIPFLLFGLWAFIGLFFALDQPNSIHDFYAHYIKYVIFYFILINTFNTPKRLTMIVWAIILSAVIFSCWSLFTQYLIMGKPLGSRMGSAKGLPEFVTNISELITIFALLLSLHEIPKQRSPALKTFLLLGIFPLLAASILPQSRSSIISIAIALLIFFGNKPKILIPLISCVIILLFVGSFPKRIASRFTESKERIFLYIYSFEVIKDHPITGTGFDLNVFEYIRQNMPAEFTKYQTNTKNTFYTYFPQNIRKFTKKKKSRKKRIISGVRWPHNMFFSTAIRSGIIGLTLFASILVSNLKIGWSLARNSTNGNIKEQGITFTACFIMFLTKGFFEPIFTHFGDIIFYSILAMTTISWQMQMTNQKEMSPKLDTEIG